MNAWGVERIENAASIAPLRHRKVVELTMAAVSSDRPQSLL